MATTTYPHLSHAPIKEAILDIRVVTAATVEATEEFAKRVSITHPDSSPIKTTQAFISSEAAQTPLAHRIMGRICWNKERTRAVQARIDGFTVNHVKNYDSWEALRDQAGPFWTEYVNVLHPTKVSAVGLRYINRIPVPPGGTFGQYVNTYPLVGPDLPQTLRNFFMRVELPFSDRHTALLTQTVVPADPGNEEPGLVLDIHAVSAQEFDPASPQLWNELDRLREIKNACFFGSVKEETWRRYE